MTLVIWLRHRGLGGGHVVIRSERQARAALRSWPGSRPCRRPAARGGRQGSGASSQVSVTAAVAQPEGVPLTPTGVGVKESDPVWPADAVALWLLSRR